MIPNRRHGSKADDKIEMVVENMVHIESSGKMELMAIDGESKLDIKAGTIKMN